jgi:hydrogenase maturation factor
MCVTRAARVISLDGAKARVRFLDSEVVHEVDISMVDAKKGSYVEVFADQAIGRITKREAEFKRDLRRELNRIRMAAQ